MEDYAGAFPQASRHLFRIIAFDWYGTAVKNRAADARPVARVLESLLKHGVLVLVITGTNFDIIDRQFCSLIKGAHKHNLFVCSNRGSEVFGFDERSQPVLLYRREATTRENELLDRVAEAVKDDIEKHSNASIDIVFQRLNRRKIDLIPEWVDPLKSQIGKLIKATNKRLRDAGFAGGIKAAFELAERYAKELGLEDARITSDVKHIEVGLTDKADSIRWMIDELARKRNIPLGDTLVLGDEFGPIAGFEGSDFRMVVPGLSGIPYVSVGKEPNGVPGGVIRTGGGPRCFSRLMREQVLLRERLSCGNDPASCLIEEGYNRLRQREVESLLAIGNGYLGTRASLEEQGRTCWPATFVAGVYDKIDDDSLEELIMFPEWLLTWVYVDGKKLVLETDKFLEHRRVTDMKKGIYRREWRHVGPGNRITSISFLHFASLDDPHALVSRVTVVPENYGGEITVKTGLKWYGERKPALMLLDKSTDRDGRSALIKAATHFTDIIAAEACRNRPRQGFLEVDYSARIEEAALYDAWSWRAGAGQEITIDKLTCIYTSRDTDRVEQDACAHLAELEERGIDNLLLDHLHAWEERLKTASITIKGDGEAQRWVNFSIYHLISAGNAHDDRVSIGARALTGPVYKGHVFWDSEIFVLPFFVLTHPPTARAMLMYRYNTLPAARARAKELGCRGALFAWESTITGEDMTPTFALGRKGTIVPIVSGQLEQHISADVAYGVWFYWNATRDDHFLIAAGAEILIETARFWTSRVDKEGDAYHIKYVEGPDEFHEIVDDNMYTNMMAAWNLRQAARVVEFLRGSYPQEFNGIKKRISLDDRETDGWLEVAREMYRDMAGSNDLIEQFAGFFALEDIDVRDYEPRTAAMDVILGREITAKTRVTKQADVVMLLYLLECEFGEKTIRENFDYYDIRTAHDSSLSPSMYGLVAARLGLMRSALRYFRQAGQVDLADNMGNAAGGVHTAALGGLWQQVVMGFAGVRVGEEGVSLYPKLPASWGRLEFSLEWRGCRLGFNVQRGKKIELTIAGGKAVRAGIFGQPLQDLEAGSSYVSTWDGNNWNVFVYRG
jgi:trehalose/maltose hydrolase-like predicted phosphorylase/hydroxymethylpyrimidine pyrophosphatase-like HAD family hydrolase